MSTQIEQRRAEARQSAPAARPAVAYFEPVAPIVVCDRLLRIQGYADPARVRPAIVRAAEEMARRAEQLSRPRVAYQYREVVVLDSEVMELSYGGRLRSRAFAPRLAGCIEIAPFVLSCGLALDQAVIALADAGDLLEAVLLETAGWLCIEDATRQLKAMLQREAGARACRITSRMGPGYDYRVGDEQVDWPLADQVEFFRLFEGPELPATLMPSCAMNPKLSRSGLFGIAPLSTRPFHAAAPGSLN